MRLLALSLCVFVFSAAAATIGREYRAAYLARQNDASIIQQFATDSEPLTIPLSNRGLRDFLMMCGRVQIGIAYQLQPQGVQSLVDSRCINTTQAILKLNPTFSAAHTIVMTGSQATSDVVAALLLSQATAPRESWNARLRLTKGLSLHGSTDSRVDKALDADLDFMLQSFEGMEWVAKLYRQDETSRAIIVAAVERRPDDQKAAFLKEMKRLAQGHN